MRIFLWQVAQYFCSSDGDGDHVRLRPGVRRDRRSESRDSSAEEGYLDLDKGGSGGGGGMDADRWRRILLLIIAVTVHNIPEGLAVGVGFGAIGQSKTATFESARYFY